MDQDPGTTTFVGRPGGSATRRCGRCGEENAADATFCAACTALLAAYDAPAGAQPPSDVAGPLAAADEHVPLPPDAPVVPAPEPLAAEPILTIEIDDTTEPETEPPTASEPGVPDVIELAPEEPSVARDLEPLASVVLDGQAQASESVVPVLSPPVESELVGAPMPERRTTASGGERPSRNGAIPPPEPATATAAIAPPVPAAVAQDEVARRRPAKPGRLARSSPEAILTAGAALWLVACALIGYAEAAGEVGAVGGAGLAVGTVALYVVAVGLIQAVLRRGDPL